MLSIEPVADDTGTPIGGVYDLGPDGTEFAVGVTLVFDMSGIDLGDTSWSELWVATREDSGWVLLPNAFTRESEESVVGRTVHFTAFGVVPVRSGTHLDCPLRHSCDPP